MNGFYCHRNICKHPVSRSYWFLDHVWWFIFENVALMSLIKRNDGCTGYHLTVCLVASIRRLDGPFVRSSKVCLRLSWTTGNLAFWLTEICSVQIWQIIPTRYCIALGCKHVMCVTSWSWMYLFRLMEVKSWEIRAKKNQNLNISVCLTGKTLEVCLWTPVFQSVVFWFVEGGWEEQPAELNRKA